MSGTRCAVASVGMLSLALVASPALAGKDPEETVAPNILFDKPAKQLEAQNVKLVRKGEKFIVPTCRVGFRLENKATASTDSAKWKNLGRDCSPTSPCSTDASVSMSVVLGNVSNADMQAATDAVCADFVEKLRKVGREVTTWAELGGNKAYDGIDFAEPKKDGVYHEGFNGADYIVLAPSTGKLFFTHENLGLGDQGPASLGNWRALNELSAKAGAVVLVPHFMVNFAEMSTSGNRSFSNSAEVGAVPALGFEPIVTRLHLYQAKMRLAGDMGGITFKEARPVSNAIGEIRQQQASDNSGIVLPLANLFGATSAMTSRKSLNVMVADPAAYKAELVRGAGVLNDVYVQVIDGYVKD